jgi:AcrR family transcriptional regulator
MRHKPQHRAPSPRRRTGRRERRRAETRARIYQAALHLFAQRGYFDTTVEDITEAADVGKGTFFNYFPTKEHVLASFGDERLAAIERAVERSKRMPTLEAIRELVCDVAGQSGQTPALLRAIFAAHASSEPVRAKLQDRVLRARQLFTQIFARGQQRGEVRGDVPAEQLGKLIHLIFFGVTLAWTMNPDSSLRDTVTDVWHLVSPGLVSANSSLGAPEPAR